MFLHVYLFCSSFAHVPDLDKQAHLLVSQGLSFNSRKSYSTSLRRYLKFCEEYLLDPLRLDETNFLRFIAHLSAANLTLASIRVYLSGIRAWVISMGHPPPPIYSERVKWALRAVGKSDPDPIRAAPISYHQLLQLQRSLQFTRDNFMFFTAVTLGYFACLRASEFCHNPKVSPPLLPSALRFVQAPTPYCLIRIPSSKTSPKGFSLVLGCSQARVCAHCNLVDYLAQRHAPASDPLFVLKDGTPLTQRRLAAFMKLHIPHAPSDRITPHSLRAGATTEAFLHDLPQQEIQQLGRWKSDAYKAYIRPSIPVQAQTAAKLAYH